MTTARLIAIVTGIIGAVLAIATPLLPVQQDVATLSWPQSSFGSVNAPLVSYSPVDIDARIPCTALTQLDGSGTVISTAPIAAAKTEQKALIVRVDDGRLQVLLRDRVLAEAPIDELSGDCALTVSSNAARTVSARCSVFAAAIGAVDITVPPPSSRVAVLHGIVAFRSSGE